MPGLGESVSRDAVVHLLNVLFNLHPANTCQPTHIEPLVRIYGGTLSASDLQLLSIFQLYEQQRKASVASLISQWSPSSNTISSNALDAIQNLDPIRVLRTCLIFPKWRRLEDQAEMKHTCDAEIYDPVLLILIFARMLSDSPPDSAFAWVQLFRTNIASLLIRSMSSKDNRVRDVAYCQLAGLWKCLEVSLVMLELCKPYR